MAERPGEPPEGWVFTGTGGFGNGYQPEPDEEFRQRSESIENLDRQAALGEPGTQPGEEPVCRSTEPTG